MKMGSDMAETKHVQYIDKIEDNIDELENVLLLIAGALDHGGAYVARGKSLMEFSMYAIYDEIVFVLHLHFQVKLRGCCIKMRGAMGAHNDPQWDRDGFTMREPCFQLMFCSRIDILSFF